MPVFESESEFLRTMEDHDSLVKQFLSGDLKFADFRDAYGNFYWLYALDGHESNSAKLALFDRHRARIEVHRVIAEEILSNICSDSDAKLEPYKAVGRLGSFEAAKRLRQLVTVRNGMVLVSK